jgi:hypothetical protein
MFKRTAMKLLSLLHWMLPQDLDHHGSPVVLVVQVLVAVVVQDGRLLFVLNECLQQQQQTHCVLSARLST